MESCLQGNRAYQRWFEWLAAAHCLQPHVGVRVLLATIVVAGCSFEHGEPQAGEGSGSVDDPTMPDASVSTAVMCRYADSALRLCVEFDDGNYSDATDGSPYHMNPDTSGVIFWDRAGTKAAGVFWNSKLAVAENAMLDITGAITLETYMGVKSPAPYVQSRLFANNSQYELGLRDDGRVWCKIGGQNVTSTDPLGKDVWRHIACTYDEQSEKIALYVDGIVDECQDADVTISTAGTSGTQLIDGYTGGVDDMRIFARELSSAEICTHANKTGCPASCAD